jgi:hypothetical protein
MNGFSLNLIAAWAGILLGFLSGMGLGIFFHRENWLGGYASFRRRMYRLAHISCFGLGAVNLLFYFTLKSLSAGGPVASFASWAFIVGAVTMPVCCVLMAHFPKAHLLFAVPVLSLIAGGALTLQFVVQFGGPQAPNPAADASTFPPINPQLSTINHPTTLTYP